MPLPSSAPIVLGDHLLAARGSTAEEQARWLLEALSKAPDAWLVLDRDERRIEEGTGLTYAAFLAPSETDLVDAAKVPVEQLPAIYTLRSAAPVLVEHGFGAVVHAAAEDSPPPLRFTLGDLVQLEIEGEFKASPTADQWQPVAFETSETEVATSEFFDGSSSAIETVTPPQVVIPRSLQRPLRAFLSERLPGVDYPILARNAEKKLSLVFLAASAAALAKLHDAAALLPWFFPRHYHLICVPRAP